MVERALLDLTPKKGVIMWHTCLCLDATSGEPCYVTITTNPLEFDDRRYKAQVVMHKTRSQNCAVQVARFVRRSYELQCATRVHKSTRPLEAMIGYACTRTMTYPPSYIRESINDLVAHIAATPIAALLDEVQGGVNAARTRYTVYEIRSLRNGQDYRFRGCSNKMHSVERVWRQCPPDTLTNCDLVHIGKYETREQAAEWGPFLNSDALWSRRASQEYYDRILKIDGADMIWRSDGTSAIRQYAASCVVIGPHVHIVDILRYFMEHGEWIDRRRSEYLHLR